MIRIEGLSARPSAKGNGALSELTLTIPGGRVVGLFGPRGSGKEALVKVLLGSQKANAGTLFLDGEALTPQAPRWRQDVAFCAAESRFPRSGNAWERLRHELRRPLITRSKVSLEERAEALLQGLELWECAQGTFGDFSAVQRWRFSIGRSLLEGPRCLFLEEPAPLAAGEIASTLALLEGVAAAGTTIILSGSSDMASVVFDRLIFIDGGRLVGEGAPQALADAAELLPQISIPRLPETEELVEETIMEGFVWADGPDGTFISILPEDVGVDDFYRMMQTQGVDPGVAMLQPPSVATLFQGVAGRCLDEDGIVH